MTEFTDFPWDTRYPELSFVDSTQEELILRMQPHVTFEICAEALRRNGMSIRGLPRKYLESEYLIFIALNQNWKSFSYIPEKFLTFNICYRACEINGYALGWVPAHLQFLEIKVVALKNNGFGIESFPVNELTKELCERAVEVGPDDIIQHIPELLRTQKVCELALKRDAKNLKWCSFSNNSLTASQSSFVALSQLPKPIPL